MSREGRDQQELERKLRELGNDQAVGNFLSKHGSVRTKAAYAGHLAYYLRWPNSKGIQKTISEMIKGNPLLAV